MERVIKASIAVFLIAVIGNGCQNDSYFGPMTLDDDSTSVSSDSLSDRVLIGCEGNFQYNNASLSVYDPLKGEVENNAFQNANGESVGDILQSMLQKGDSIFLVVNSSEEIKIIDRQSLKEFAVIDKVKSPRYIHIIDDARILVSGYETHQLTVFNLIANEIEQVIAAPAWTEKIVANDGFLFVEGKSDSSILIIDEPGLNVISVVSLNFDPVDLVLDDEGNVLVAGNASEGAVVKKITPQTHEPEVVTTLPKSIVAFGMRNDQLYFLQQGRLLLMNYSGDELKSIQHDLTTPYAMHIDHNFVYISDVKDYLSKGEVRGYDFELELVDAFEVGLIPQSFLTLNADD